LNGHKNSEQDKQNPKLYLPASHLTIIDIKQQTKG